VEISSGLIKDCQKNDRKAQFKLYRLCFAALMPVCMRYRRNEADASAMMNAGFLKILDNIHTFHPPKPFEAWAKRIMINTLIDDFRKERNVRELIEYTDFADYDDTDELVDLNEADKQFDAERLELLIQQLPPMTQKVFNLYAIDGYKHYEIAEMLGISDGTSKWHLSSARKRLQEMMKAALNSTKVI
jgi:RNA polymerase sigma factor (sigma-70 family)